MALLNELANLPLPTLMVLTGLALLSAGFGMKLNIGGINLDKVNKFYARILGTILLAVGLIIFLFKELGLKKIFLPEINDPFLLGYLISAPAVIIVIWVVLKFSDSENQVQAAKKSFFFFGFLATIAVVWRGVDVIVYCVFEKGMPVGLGERSSYLPYFGLFAIALAAMIWTIYGCTRHQSVIKNRFTIFKYFMNFCMYLISCRLVWEIIDYIASCTKRGP
jgi:hypothetical protein